MGACMGVCMWPDHNHKLRASACHTKRWRTPAQSRMCRTWQSHQVKSHQVKSTTCPDHYRRRRVSHWSRSVVDEGPPQAAEVVEIVMAMRMAMRMAVRL